MKSTRTCVRTPERGIESRLRTGFTLIEILVVVLIIVILMGLLLPAINAARENARATQCLNNQHELGVALVSYDNAKKRLPGALSYVNPTSINSPNPDYTVKNWVMDIFGELGRMDLWQDWQKAAGTPVKVAQLLCPNNPNKQPVGGLSYVVNIGAFNPDNEDDFSGRLFRDRTKIDSSNAFIEPEFSIASIRSPARTVMLSESLRAGQWSVAANMTPGLAFRWPWNPASSATPYSATNPGPSISTILSANHRGYIIVTFCDGHSEKLSETTHTWFDPDNPLFGVP